MNLTLMLFRGTATGEDSTFWAINNMNTTKQKLSVPITTARCQYFSWLLGQ